jgi:hypothetical protein
MIDKESIKKAFEQNFGYNSVMDRYTRLIEEFRYYIYNLNIADLLEIKMFRASYHSDREFFEDYVLNNYHNNRMAYSLYKMRLIMNNLQDIRRPLDYFEHDFVTALEFSLRQFWGEKIEIDLHDAIHGKLTEVKKPPEFNDIKESEEVISGDDTDENGAIIYY